MTLPSTLRTSVETKNASIAYALRCCLIYKNSGKYLVYKYFVKRRSNPKTTFISLDNETNELHFVRGITIVEKFDIGVLPPEYFHPTPHNLVKKFGLFSCTGGQIRLNFQICRAAFVCGENITIEGRIFQNKKSSNFTFMSFSN